MTDRRQQALDRLEAILGSVPDIAEVFHNRGDIPEDKRPAAVLLDGPERVETTVRGGRPGSSPVLVTMTPQIFFEMPAPNPQNDGVGESLNAIRVNALKLILTDETLHEILTTNGYVRYLGMESDLVTGRAMQGESELKIALTYPLIPDEL
jgi:hypothetical protein